MATVARRLAARLTSKRYVAIPFDYGAGLHSNYKPTNDYYFSLVRQTSSARPDGSSSPTSSKFSIPIAPYTAPAVNAHTPLSAVAPFPFSNCEIDTASGTLKARVTSTQRDRTPVLPLLPEDMDRLLTIRRDHVLRLYELQRGHQALQRAKESLPDAERVESMSAQLTPSHAIPDTSNALPVDDARVVAALTSALVDYAGDPDLPVVNVHYDLDLVDAVEDPQDLRREEEKLLEIMRDARARMAQAGIQPRYPSYSTPWDDGIMDDLERVMQHSLLALHPAPDDVVEAGAEVDELGVITVAEPLDAGEVEVLKDDALALADESALVEVDTLEDDPVAEPDADVDADDPADREVPSTLTRLVMVLGCQEWS
ncbi:unnamed protein product [Peniophora sp. CBMAI 1063]|nr:unnamed protein product [Peniophora sp. CBMAI 1063]